MQNKNLIVKPQITWIINSIIMLSVVKLMNRVYCIAFAKAAHRNHICAATTDNSYRCYNVIFYRRPTSRWGHDRHCPIVARWVTFVCQRSAGQSVALRLPWGASATLSDDIVLCAWPKSHSPVVMNTFVYFAYGSNLLAQRIHIQNPSAVRIGIGKLNVCACAC